MEWNLLDSPLETTSSSTSYLSSRVCLPRGVLGSPTTALLLRRLACRGPPHQEARCCHRVAPLAVGLFERQLRSPGWSQSGIALAASAAVGGGDCGGDGGSGGGDCGGGGDEKTPQETPSTTGGSGGGAEVALKKPTRGPPGCLSGLFSLSGSVVVLSLVWLRCECC